MTVCVQQISFDSCSQWYELIIKLQDINVENKAYIYLRKLCGLFVKIKSDCLGHRVFLKLVGLVSCDTIYPSTNQKQQIFVKVADNNRYSSYLVVKSSKYCSRISILSMLGALLIKPSNNLDLGKLSSKFRFRCLFRLYQSPYKQSRVMLWILEILILKIAFWLRCLTIWIL